MPGARGQTLHSHGVIGAVHACMHACCGLPFGNASSPRLWLHRRLECRRINRCMHCRRQTCPLQAAAQCISPQRRSVMIVVVQAAEALARHPVGAGSCRRVLPACRQSARLLAANRCRLGRLLLLALQHSTGVAVWKGQAHTCQEGRARGSQPGLIVGWDTSWTRCGGLVTSVSTVRKEVATS